METKKQFEEALSDLQSKVDYIEPMAYGIGIRRRKSGKTLDVYFPIINWKTNPKTSAIIRHVLNLRNKQSGFTSISQEQLQSICEHFKPFLNELECHQNWSLLQQLKEVGGTQTGYSRKDIGVFFLFNDQLAVESPEEAYFKLHTISGRHIKPHESNLDGIFGQLETIAWTNYGPILPDDVPTVRLKTQFNERPLQVSHVDKFPYLVNYIIPDGVRIASGSQVRLGAYLSKGTTVMPAGYVNFNAGTLGNAMVEGRVSAGVLIGEDSDVGGGASIMGTLSGGNHHVISVGSQCLLGANAGIGISLGNQCTVEAGLYITAGMKVKYYNHDRHPINSHGDIVADGDNIVKASDLSGRSHLLFMRDSRDGYILCRQTTSSIELNDELHAHN